MRYYTVTAKCGHVGRDCYIPITFAVKANSAKEAASVTRFLPRVKHHHKDAILSVEEVDFSAYQDRCYINSFDPFLQCSNRQEQRQEFDAIYFRIMEEDGQVPRSKRELPEKPVYNGKERIRNVRRFAREQASAYGMLEAI